jgi:hypothetical protein
MEFMILCTMEAFLLISQFNANLATIDAPIGIYNNLRLEITNCITAEDIDIVIATPETPTIGIDQINQPVNCIDGGSIDFVFYRCVQWFLYN